MFTLEFERHAMARAAWTAGNEKGIEHARRGVVISAEDAAQDDSVTEADWAAWCEGYEKGFLDTYEPEGDE